MDAGMDTMTVLADPVRRQVVELLAEGERSAGEIGERFPIAQPSMSRHLRVLREAGVVRVRVDATRRMYSLNPQSLEEVERWAARHLALWHKKFDKLGEHLDAMAAAERADAPAAERADAATAKQRRSRRRVR
jgi:DNA-binding transcriptional ArsR family regulator